MTNFRTAYSGVYRSGISFDPSTRIVKGSFKDECDINRIMAKYQRTGQLPEVRSRAGQFVDVSAMPEYLDALNLVIEAQDTFAALPAEIRRECSNDPAVFLDRCNDPSWLVKHGLASTPLPAAVEASKLASGGSNGQTDNGRGPSDRSVDSSVGGVGERQTQATG